jgi:hypothetical protein
LFLHSALVASLQQPDFPELLYFLLQLFWSPDFRHFLPPFFMGHSDFAAFTLSLGGICAHIEVEAVATKRSRVMIEKAFFIIG